MYTVDRLKLEVKQLQTTSDTMKKDIERMQREWERWRQNCALRMQEQNLDRSNPRSEEETDDEGTVRTMSATHDSTIEEHEPVAMPAILSNQLGEGGIVGEGKCHLVIRMVCSKSCFVIFIFKIYRTSCCNFSSIFILNLKTVIFCTVCAMFCTILNRVIDNMNPELKINIYI